MAPSDDEIQVRVARTGLCGSDLHYYSGFRNGNIAVREPLTLGRESSGVVAAVGRRVGPERFKIGDRVAVEVGLPCKRQGATSTRSDRADSRRWSGGTSLRGRGQDVARESRHHGGRAGRAARVRRGERLRRRDCCGAGAEICSQIAIYVGFPLRRLLPVVCRTKLHADASPNRGRHGCT